MIKARTLISRTERGEIAVSRQELVGHNWVQLSTNEVTKLYTGHVPEGTPWGWVVAILITIAPRPHLPVQELSAGTDPEQILPSIY